MTAFLLTDCIGRNYLLIGLSLHELGPFTRSTVLYSIMSSVCNWHNLQITEGKEDLLEEVKKMEELKDQVKAAEKSKFLYARSYSTA